VSVVFGCPDDRVVAEWVATLARGRGDLDRDLDGDLEVDVLDLTIACLPDVDRCAGPTPPAVRDLAPWLRFADGFVVVVPRSHPSPVVRAVQWCADEWRAKPVAFAGVAPPALISLFAAVPVVLTNP
jgi:NAD(P)H-dependent FMN reductase